MSFTNYSNLPNADGSTTKVSMRFNEDKTVDAYVQTLGEERWKKVPRTEEEIDEAFPYIPLPQPKPEPVSQEALDLYKKAIDTPDALTNEERWSIQGWVSDNVADGRCLQECGITWQELITRAVNTPQDLTRDDSVFIQIGRSITYKDGDADVARLRSILKQPEHVRDLWERADRATVDSQYSLAISNAHKEGNRIRREREEALSHLSTDDTSNINQSTRIPWIPHLMASKSRWGMVCFRTAYDDGGGWERYKEHLLQCSRTGLWVHPGTDRLTRDWELYFVENDKERLDGASLEDLCTYFNTPPPTSTIPSATASGLRSDVFLFADARAISSQDVIASDPALKGRVHPPGAPFNTEHLIRGYVNAADASYDPAKEYAHGFVGFLKVHPAHTATTFYHRLKVPGEEQEHGAEEWWKLKQSWETMFECANGSGGREGGVYPPKWSYNR